MDLIGYLKQIGKYKEGMTFEEISTALAEAKLASGETIDKATFDKTASELANIKKQMKDKMTEDEKKAEAEKERAEAFSNLQKENAIFKQTQIFIKSGYDADTAAKLAEHLANGEMDKFAEAQGAWATAQKEQIKNQITEELMKKQTPPPAGGKTDETDDVKFASELGKTIAESEKSSSETINSYFN